MNRKIITCFLVCVILTLMSTISIADAVMPCADLYFDSATAFLASNKSVVFDCVAYAIHNKISITSVWLEQQIAGQWEYVKNLTPPSYVSENLPDYGAVCYYSADIGTGTFRVGFTVDADGYAISRYSNARTF